MVAAYWSIIKHVGFSKINTCTETCQKGKQYNPVVQSSDWIHQTTITSNFENDNFLTSPQNISFDLQAITQLKQLLAIVVRS